MKKNIIHNKNVTKAIKVFIAITFVLMLVPVVSTKAFADETKKAEGLTTELLSNAESTLLQQNNQKEEQSLPAIAKKNINATHKATAKSADPDYGSVWFFSLKQINSGDHLVVRPLLAKDCVTIFSPDELTSKYFAQAMPYFSTEQWTYDFSYWTINYKDGRTVTVDPDVGYRDVNLTCDVEIIAHFSRDFTRYNVIPDVTEKGFTEKDPTTFTPTTGYSDIPYGSTISYKGHTIFIKCPDEEEARTIECKPGSKSVHVAWYFGETQMEEGKEYTVQADTNLHAVVVQGSLLQGQIREANTGYYINDAWLYFEYSSYNELDPETVGPVFSENEGNFKFVDPLLKTGYSGTLYVYRAGYDTQKIENVNISEEGVAINVELSQPYGSVYATSQDIGHDCFDVTYQGATTEKTGPRHARVAELNKAVPAAQDPDTPGKDKGTIFTFCADKITTIYQTDFDTPQPTNEVQKYCETSVIMPVAKQGYIFDHFTLDGRQVEEGDTFEVKEDLEYKITAVYKLVPAGGDATGIGSTGDNLWIFFLIAGIALVVAGAGIGYALYRKNKGGKKDKYIPKH